MAKPTVSILASASRPENWMVLYDSIGENDVAFELIFVGPNPPKHDLPENFKYIRSNVKPAQCFEIASRNASGELLMIVPDDLRFISQHPIDKLYAAHTTSNNTSPIVSTEYNFADGWNRFYAGDSTTPIIPMYWMISAKLWRDLGGVDRRFIAVCWDMDMAMRVLAIGGEVVMADVFVSGEIEMPDKPRSRGSALYRDYKATDRVLLDQLWSTDGKVHFNRSLPVEPLSDQNIIKRSQEPYGRWRYNSGVYNRVITGRVFYWLLTQRSIVSGRIHRFRIRRIPTYVARLFRG